MGQASCLWPKEALRTAWPGSALTLDCHHPEMWEINFHCLLASKSVVFCYSNLETQMVSSYEVNPAFIWPALYVKNKASVFAERPERDEQQQGARHVFRVPTWGSTKHASAPAFGSQVSANMIGKALLLPYIATFHSFLLNQLQWLHEFGGIFKLSWKTNFVIVFKWGFFSVWWTCLHASFV